MLADAPSIDAIAKSHDLALVVLFGSRATGREHLGSDWDIGVLRHDHRRMTLRELGAVQLALSPLFDGEVDLLDLTVRDAVIRRDIVRDGRVLFEADDDAWDDFATRALIDYSDVAYYVEAATKAVLSAGREPQP